MPTLTRNRRKATPQSARPTATSGQPTTAGRPSGSRGGVQGVNLIILILVAASVTIAAGLLAKTVNTARSIDGKAKSISSTGGTINASTDAIRELVETNKIARSILKTASPLDGVVGKIEARAKSINNDATSIDALASSINGTAGTINTTANSIGGSATSINSVATEINSTAGAIDSVAGGINERRRHDQPHRADDQRHRGDDPRDGSHDRQRRDVDHPDADQHRGDRPLDQGRLGEHPRRLRPDPRHRRLHRQGAAGSEQARRLVPGQAMSYTTTSNDELFRRFLCPA